MAASSSEYIYQHLDSAGGQIRLLGLPYLFKQRTGPLRGTLTNHYLPLSTMSRAQMMKRMAALPVFIALSYVWGDSTRTHDIYIDGKRIGITANLYYALSDLQMNAAYDVLVWSDAVCICQEDLVERSAQVLLMREIYQFASTVSIWLQIKQTDFEKQHCFKIMSRLCSSTAFFSWEKKPKSAAQSGSRDVEETIFQPVSWVVRAGVGFGQALVDIGTLMSPNSDSRAEIMNPSESAEMYRDMVRGFQEWRPRDRHMKNVTPNDLMIAAAQLEKLVAEDWSWFDRCWVIQELGCAENANIVAGGASLTWQSFLNVAWYMSTLNSAGENSRCRLALAELEMIRQGFGNNKRQSLYNLIRVCRYRQASDPRDKIFGLLGLMGDVKTQYLQPDYSSDVEFVYARATLHQLSTNRSLDPICGWQTVGRMERLPSWVPDYVLNQDLAMYPVNKMYMRDALFTASGADQRADYVCLDKDPTPSLWYHLPVRGILVDTIVKTSSSFSEATLKDTIMLWLSTLLDAPTLSGNLRKTTIAELERVAAAATKYATSSRFDNSLLNPFASHGTALPMNTSSVAPFTKFPDSYVVDAFLHSLFTGHICGTRLRPSDLNTIYELNPEQVSSEADRNVVNSIAFSLQCAVTRRNMAVTAKGYIGTVGEDVRPGDLLNVFYGCSIPTVSRRARAETELLFMGESYFHGLMDGEAIVLLIKEKVKENDFVLC